MIMGKQTEEASQALSTWMEYQKQQQQQQKPRHATVFDSLFM